MITLLKLIQSIIKTLHSEGTPGQVAARIATGSVLGLTPLLNVHNLVIFSLVVLLNVSFGGAMLGWALFVPVGFLLDPVFHAVGLQLLQAPSLRPLWTAMTNTPLVPYTNQCGAGRYQATVSGLTSTPTLYGRPTVVKASRRVQGSAIAAIDVDATIDHVSARTKDVATARLRGIRLPSFDIPGIPFRVEPGTGSSSLDFTMIGGGAQLSGKWAIASQQVSWIEDTAGRSMNDLERLVWRVVSGLKDLEVVAELGGSVGSPKLSVSSNLDKAIAQRLQAVMGEEVAKAERMVPGLELPKIKL